jgi:hypothetical protein
MAETDLITLSRATVQQALHVATAAGYPVALIAALKAALEQPEQERKLTDEVIADLWHQNGGFHHHFARALERWLKGQA